MTSAVLLDVDGTLVDSNYHHTIAWARAARRLEVHLPPLFELHRAVGMGGDLYVTHVFGADVERTRGDAVRAAHDEEFERLMPEVPGLDGAHELVAGLVERGRAVVLASSGRPVETEHYLRLLDIGDLVTGWTSADDVETTKPAPGLVQSALRVASIAPERALLVGDSPYDAQSASAAGVPTIGVLTGGFSAAELADAGVRATYASVGELAERLDEVLGHPEGRT